jgi:flagellar biosynthesis protein FliR
MNFTEAQITAWLGSYLWPFFRIGGMLMTAPVTGARSVSTQLRLMLVVAVTLIVAPLLPAGPQVEIFGYAWFMIIINQILIGVVMGLVFQMVFSAIITGGQIIAMQMGLGFATMVDPQNGAQVPVLSQLYLMFTTLLFLSVDGHLLFIQLLVESFEAMPVGMASIDRDSYEMYARWGSVLIASALWMALPAMASLLLINFSFGIMSRAAPQLQIFAVGFPITMMMGFIVVLYTLPGTVVQFYTILERGIALVRSIIWGG